MPVLKELDGSHGLDLHPITDAEISNSQVAATLGLALANVTRAASLAGAHQLEHAVSVSFARQLRSLSGSSTYAGILFFDCLCGHQQLVFFVRAL